MVSSESASSSTPPPFIHNSPWWSHASLKREWTVVKRANAIRADEITVFTRHKRPWPGHQRSRWYPGEAGRLTTYTDCCLPAEIQPPVNRSLAAGQPVNLEVCGASHVLDRQGVCSNGSFCHRGEEIHFRKILRTRRPSCSVETGTQRATSAITKGRLNVGLMLGRVFDAGPTLSQHWVNVWCFLNTGWTSHNVNQHYLTACAACAHGRRVDNVWGHPSWQYLRHGT